MIAPAALSEMGSRRRQCQFPPSNLLCSSVIPAMSTQGAVAPEWVPPLAPPRDAAAQRQERVPESLAAGRPEALISTAWEKEALRERTL